MNLKSFMTFKSEICAVWFLGRNQRSNFLPLAQYNALHMNWNFNKNICEEATQNCLISQNNVLTEARSL